MNQTEDKVRGFRSGAVDYVSKPFQKEEVIARVSTHLKLRQALRAVESERQKSEDLLLTILPKAVADELKEKGTSEPQAFPDVSILFSDIVGFTGISSTIEPKELISELNEIFTAFDDIMASRGCERIKTIGDAYFAAAGLPLPLEDHALAITRAAQDIVRFLVTRNASGKRAWEIRVGIHSGGAVGGIVGTRRYIYDVFGDTVNTASRMEAASLPMRINVSEATKTLIDGKVRLSPRETSDIKGKGPMRMYFVDE